MSTRNGRSDLVVVGGVGRVGVIIEFVSIILEFPHFLNVMVSDTEYINYFIVIIPNQPDIIINAAFKQLFLVPLVFPRHFSGL